MTERVITSCCYYKALPDYARSVAKSGGRGMLFSSGDSSRTLASNLSGEGLDAGEQEASPFSFAVCSHLPHQSLSVNSKTF
jgi:hypothetical protein